MARPATGQIVEHKGTDGRVYRALRLTAYGERRSVALGPISREQAEAECAQAAAAIRRGTWVWAEPLNDQEKEAVIAAQRAKLSSSRQTAAEAYSLVRKALQAVDRAAQDATGSARTHYTRAWHDLDGVAQDIDRGLRSA